MIKNLIIRTLSGAILVALVIASILLSPYYLFGAVFLLLTVLGLREFYSLCAKFSGADVDTTLPIVCGSLAFISSYLYLFFDINLWGLFAISAVAVFVVELFRKKSNPILNIAISVMGIVYVAMPIVAMSYLEKYNPFYLLAFFMVIWASDTGAYLTGLCFGKHKMFERVSPKKTWEGLFGGLASAMLVGYLFFRLGNSELGLEQWIIFSFAVFVSGTLGDLVESLFKRTLGVKDSGSLMPGHGGMLDRFDSSLLAAPVSLAVLSFILTYL